MSPAGPIGSGRTVAPNNLYTIILATALCIVVVTAAFVIYKCLSQYNTIFGVP